jgi:hypothetical protein
MLGTDVHLEAFSGLERLAADRAGVKESCTKATFQNKTKYRPLNCVFFLPISLIKFNVNYT